MHRRWIRTTLWTLPYVAAVACGNDAKDRNPLPDASEGSPDASASDGNSEVPSGFVQIADLNTRGLAVVPQNFVEFGSMILFSTYDNTHGERIFRSDGTALGTQMLAALNPNLDLPARNISAPDLHGGVAFGGEFFFTENDHVHGQELWKTDGTPEGTMLAFDLNPGFGGVTNLTMMGNSLYFYAAATTNGTRSLWRSDGTAAGTSAFLEQYDSPLTVLGDKLIFAAGGTGPQGREPWISDGTAAGSHILRDVYPGANGGQPTSFTRVGNRVFFWANDGVHGTEVWSTDGSEAGTILAGDVNPGPGDGQASGYTFAAFNGEAYFRANDGSSGAELWKSNGTSVTRVKDIAPGATGSSPVLGVVVGNTFFFTANDGTHGFELWKTDGTEAGTSLVKDIFAGSSSSQPYGLVAYDGLLYFVADDGVHGAELWRSDGSEAGTTLVKDIRPGSTGAGIAAFYAYSAPTAVLGKLLFGADDGEHDQALYTSDGTEAGTHMLVDLSGGVNSSSIDLTNAPTVTRGNQMLFYATDGSPQPAPYVTDGTPAGTTRLAELALVPLSSSVRQFSFPVVAGGQFFFAASDTAHGLELWCSDGTPAGTRLTRDVGPAEIGGVDPSQPLVVSGNLVYFAGPGGLWKSDGTEAGTVPALDQSVPSNVLQLGTNAPHAFDLGGTVLFFGANNAMLSTSALLRIDGTTATTLSSVPGMIGFGGGIEGAVVGNKLYFTTGAGSLWSSDGTPDGTQQITRIGTGSTASVHSFVGLGAQVAFVGNDGTQGAQLWSTDGSAEGTRLVSTINPSGAALIATAGVPFAVMYHDRLFFPATDGTSGVELWSSDLTAAGTLRVADIAPGDASSNPATFTIYRDLLYFTATDGVHGTELWRTDGTSAQLVGDLNSGPHSSPSMPAGVLGHDLILFGNDGMHGVEPWRFTAP